MTCPSCGSDNDEAAESCFTCGKALFALTQGVLLSGRYEILRPLGRGGMGRVYKARDQVLDEDVAIKVLRPEFTREPEMARRFRSEIKLARKVSHRNVCRIHEYGEDGSLAFISMEYIEGINLKEFLAVRRLGLEEAFDLVIQVAEGLAAVHEHGIIHRDFKASNIMIDVKGVVKLMDFGIAKEAASETTGVTGSGVVGTPEYMSPEQAGGGRLDFRSDIYSFGCVVFEVFTGAAPFRGDSPLGTMYKHVHEEPPLESSAIPEPLKPLLRQALTKDPKQRIASVPAFAEALRDARVALGLGGSTGRVELGPLASVLGRPSAPTTTLPSLAPLPRPRRMGGGPLWPWIAAILLLSAAAVAVILGLWPPAEAPEPPRVTAASPTAPRELQPTATPTPSAASTPTPVSEPPAAAPRPRSSPPGAALATPQPTAAPLPPRPRVTATPASRAAEAELGTLSLLVVPAAPVTIDGGLIGTVSLREIPLAPGPHVVRILHPDYEPLQRKVTIHPGAATKLVLDLSEKGIRKRP